MGLVASLVQLWLSSPMANARICWWTFSHNGELKKVASWIAANKSWHYALHEESGSICCFMVRPLNAPPLTRSFKKQPVVDLLSSWSRFQSEYFSLVRLKSLSFGYTRVRDFVPCRYRKTRLPTNQWEFAGFSVNQESTFTIQIMSGLVCFALCNRDPTRLLYAASPTNCFSSVALNILRLFPAGVLVGWLSCILKFSMIISINVSWSIIIFSEISVTCTPKKHPSFARSSILNFVPKILFNSSCPASYFQRLLSHQPNLKQRYFVLIFPEKSVVIFNTQEVFVQSRNLLVLATSFWWLFSSHRVTCWIYRKTVKFFKTHWLLQV